MMVAQAYTCIAAEVWNSGWRAGFGIGAFASAIMVNLIWFFLSVSEKRA